jgi:hypothetical protein
MEVFKSNFCSPFIKDSIKETTKNVKKFTKIAQSAQIGVRHQKMFQIGALNK